MSFDEAMRTAAARGGYIPARFYENPGDPAPGPSDFGPGPSSFDGGSREMAPPPPPTMDHLFRATALNTKWKRRGEGDFDTALRATEPTFHHD